MDTYLEQAAEQRCADFKTVREWVFGQIDHNLPQFAHDLACMLAGAEKPADDPDWDYRLADWKAVDDMRARMSEAIAAQPATAELADAKREAAEEEEREAWDEANNPMWASDPYDEQCRVAAMHQRRREAAALDEYEREHA